MTPSYQGMSYTDASREASRLIAMAAIGARWFDLPEKLIELRHIMELHEPIGDKL